MLPCGTPKLISCNYYRNSKNKNCTKRMLLLPVSYKRKHMKLVQVGISTSNIMTCRLKCFIKSLTHPSTYIMLCSLLGWVQLRNAFVDKPKDHSPTLRYIHKHKLPTYVLIEKSFFMISCFFHLVQKAIRQTNNRATQSNKFMGLLINV